MSIISDLVYPKSSRENLRYRSRLIEKFTEAENVTGVYEVCKRDIIFTFNAFFYTFDPRKENPHIPFITYPFQDEYILSAWDDIQSGRDSLTEKSRDMGVTWMILGIFVYGWNWHGYQFKVGSRMQDMVDRIGDMDSLFERMRYLISFLPRQFLPKGFIERDHSSFCKLINPEKGNQILGEATTPSFSRAGRYKAILLDEFAFSEGANNIWQAAGDSTPCRLAVSTPHGKYNKFSDLRSEGKIKVHTLHWSKHPAKTKEWYENEKLRRKPREVAEELDINYVASAGKPFYDGYHIEAHRRKDLKLNKDLPIIRGWDFGYHHPGIVFAQLQRDRLVVYREYMGSDITLRKFRDEVIIMSAEIIRTGELQDGCREFIDYGDPAGNQKSDKDDLTSVEILSEKDIQLTSIFSTYQMRKAIIEDKLHTYDQNIPMLIVDEKCVIIDEGFQGGYHYPEKILKAYPENPEKDGWYEHLFNALEYICVNIFNVRKDDGYSNENDELESSMHDKKVANYGYGARTRVA